MNRGESRGILPMVPGLHAAVVDEADAVLIDEGVVPLIIARSRREDDMAKAYVEASQIAQKLDEGNDYEVDYVLRKVKIKFRGEQRLVGLFGDALARGAQPIFKATRPRFRLARLHGQSLSDFAGDLHQTACRPARTMGSR